MHKHVVNFGLIVILAPCIFTLAVSWPLLDAAFAADTVEAGQGKTKTNRMVLVLDASGSMWGQIDGKAKIEIAKEVMAELIDEIPADFQTGLTVHGHTRKVIGRTDINVTPIQAAVQAPAEADVAVEFEVNWQGPGNQSDYIAISRPDQSPGSQIGYTYTSRGNPLKVRAPSDPGTYEVRYILGS